jgi:hypothetical protein
MIGALQVALYSKYLSYFNEDPQDHTRPIPTAFLPAPGDRRVLVNIHKGAISPDKVPSTEDSLTHVQVPGIDDVMEGIWNTLRKLHGVLTEERKGVGWGHPVFGKHLLLPKTLFLPVVCPKLSVQTCSGHVVRVCVVGILSGRYRAWYLDSGK